MKLEIFVKFGVYPRYPRFLSACLGLHISGSYFAVVGAGAGWEMLQLAGLSMSATFKP